MKITPEIIEAFKNLFHAAKVFELDPKLAHLVEKADPKAYMQLKRAMWGIENEVNASEWTAWARGERLKESADEAMELAKMQKFTRQQIGEEVALVQSGNLAHTESKVFLQWQEFADDMLHNADYSETGFRGFYDRSAREILLDFHVQGKLQDDLTEKELFDLLAELACLD